jgi:hypothetical protein
MEHEQKTLSLANIWHYEKLSNDDSNDTRHLFNFIGISTIKNLQR